jgi:hypothetical protein
VSRDHPSRDAKSIPSTAHQRHFRIELRGQVDQGWMTPFDLISFSNSMEITTIVVLADQAALRGIVNRLWDLNLDIHSVVAITWPSVVDGGK